MIICIDFDDCLCLGGRLNEAIMSVIEAHHQAGDEIHIMTARSRRGENPLFRDTCMDPGYNILIADFIDAHNLPITDVHFTNHELKGPFLNAINADHHYDDKHEHLSSAHHSNVVAFHVNKHIITKYDPNAPFDCKDNDCFVCSDGA